MEPIKITITSPFGNHEESLDAELCKLWMDEQGLDNIKDAIGRFTEPILERGYQLKAKADFEKAKQER